MPLIIHSFPLNPAQATGQEVTSMFVHLFARAIYIYFLKLSVHYTKNCYDQKLSHCMKPVFYLHIGAIFSTIRLFIYV